MSGANLAANGNTHIERVPYHSLHTEVELEVPRRGQVSPAIVADARKLLVQHVEHLGLSRADAEEAGQRR